MVRNSYRFVDSEPRRRRATVIARLTGSLVCAIIVVGVYVPVMGLLGSVGAATIGAVRVPFGAIVLSTAITFAVAIGFLVLAFRTRIAALAWVSAVAAAVACLIGAVWPLVGTAFASATQTENVIETIQRLLQSAGIDL